MWSCFPRKTLRSAGRAAHATPGPNHEVYHKGRDRRALFWPPRHGIVNPCPGRLTLSTGQGALRTTFSAVDPNIAWLNPVRPCVESTMRSARRSLASRTISTNGRPWTTAISVGMPPGTLVAAISSSRAQDFYRISSNIASVGT